MLRPPVSRPVLSNECREPSRSPAHTQSGLTLVELLFAAAILAFTLLAVLAVLPQALGSARKSGRMMVINQLAVEKLEELRALPFDDTSLALGIHPAQVADSGGELFYPVPGFSEEYSLRWIVQNGPTDGSGTPELGMRTVVVEATFDVRYASDGVANEEIGDLSAAFVSYLTDEN